MNIDGQEAASERRARHWGTIYERDPLTVSWYQREPSRSLELIDTLHLPTGTSMVDVGGGASSLVDHLLARGYGDVTVLDVADAALRHSADRLGVAASRVAWVCHDVLTWDPDRTYDLWHDRAVFHFLTDPEDRATYRRVLSRAVAPGGHLVIATFATDGPEQCSGLPVARYDAGALADEFGPDFVRVNAGREEHTTPAGVVQPFTWMVAAKRP